MPTTMMTIPASRPTLPPEILHQIFLFISPIPDTERGSAPWISPSPSSDQQPTSTPSLTYSGSGNQQSQHVPLDGSPVQDGDDSSTEPAELHAINTNGQGLLFTGDGRGELQLPTNTPAPTANGTNGISSITLPTPAQPTSTGSNAVYGSSMYPTHPISLTISPQHSQPSSSSPSSSSHSVMTSLPHSLTPLPAPSLIKAFIPIFLASKAFYEIASKVAYREIVGLKNPLMCARFLKCIVSEGGNVEDGNQDYSSERKGDGDIMNEGTDNARIGGNSTYPSTRSGMKPSLASLVRVLKIEWMSLALLSISRRGVYQSTSVGENQVGPRGTHNGFGRNMECGEVRADTQNWRQMTLEEELADIFEDEAFQIRLGIHPGVSNKFGRRPYRDLERNNGGYDSGLVEPYDAYIRECPSRSLSSPIGADPRIHSPHTQRVYSSTLLGGTLEEKLLKLLNLALKSMTGLISLTLDLPTLLGVRVRMAELEWKHQLARHNSVVDTNGENEYVYDGDSNSDDEDHELKPLYDVLEGCKFQLRVFKTSLPCKPPLAEFLNTQPEIRELTLRGAYMEDNGSTTTSATTSGIRAPYPSESLSAILNPYFPLHPSSLPNLQHLRTVHPSPYTPLPTFVIPSRPIDSIHTAIVDHVTTFQVLNSLTRSGKKIRKLSLIIFASGLGLANLLEGLRNRDLDRKLVALHVVAVAEDYTEEGLGIAGAQLSSFTSLLYMTFMSCAGGPSRLLAIEAEKRIAKSWHDYCPSLKTIILPRGAIWFEGRKGWDCLGSVDVGSEHGREDADEGHGGDATDGT